MQDSGSALLAVADCGAPGASAACYRPASRAAQRVLYFTPDCIRDLTGSFHPGCGFVTQYVDLTQISGEMATDAAVIGGIAHSARFGRIKSEPRFFEPTGVAGIMGIGPNALSTDYGRTTFASLQLSGHTGDGLSFCLSDDGGYVLLGACDATTRAFRLQASVALQASAWPACKAGTALARCNPFGSAPTRCTTRCSQPRCCCGHRGMGCRHQRSSTWA